MSSAATPKGERRRMALVEAAADLMLEGGFEAVRHRAVAQRAGLPLASTTYYFESLDDLIARAVELSGSREMDAMRARIDEITQADRDAAAVVELIIELLVGPIEGAAREHLIARYECFIASARHPQLQEVQRRLRIQFDDALGEVLRRSGRQVRQEGLRRLICVVDGAVVGALSESDPDPEQLAREMLSEVIDVAAPPLPPEEPES
ncbi:TetR/AcrR family transcriptional regulator [Rhodococcus sp. UNC363MFTsu5.1]|uniref:TetR/AcrR family transcriptional regulator n=1 Tax=Rhodococcus sp. UNC363MFTsu5.1 TaxID=1449069 RepID=UPI0004872DFE|nr:TetR family transcriptional regulator [Rhodococcus sp. UNC363MFTsu5.1]